VFKVQPEWRGPLFAATSSSPSRHSRMMCQLNQIIARKNQLLGRGAD